MFKEDASESFSCGGGCRHSAPSRSWRNSVSDNPYEALRLNISWNAKESLKEPTSLTIPTASDVARRLLGNPAKASWKALAAAYAAWVAVPTVPTSDEVMRKKSRGRILVTSWRLMVPVTFGASTP